MVQPLRFPPTPRLQAGHAAEHLVAVGEGRRGRAALRAGRARVAPVLAALDGHYGVTWADALLRERHGAEALQLGHGRAVGLAVHGRACLGLELGLGLG